MLLEKDVVEINPPKMYLPHIRKQITKFYISFSEIHNLKNLNRIRIEVAIQIISTWCEKAVQEIHRKSDNEWCKGLIIEAQTELSNAQDCLKNEDLRVILEKLAEFAVRRAF